jgi:preprotein translocase subunit SecF
MSEIKYETADDELSIVDVLNFLKRQYKNIILIFILSFSLVCVYIFTRPTIYESSADVVVGTKFFFANANANANAIETSEQIKYLYSSKANITPIKNTSVVRVIAKNTNKDASEKAVEETIGEIIKKHKEYLQEKKDEAIQLLKLTNNSNKENATELIDKISASSTTRQATAITTATLTYSGMLKKGLGLGFIGSIFFAFFVAIGLEFIIKIRKTIRAT